MPPTEQGKRDLLEVYRHLDRTGPMGDKQISWYGQLRAEGYTHAEALERTIEHYQLRNQDWYQLRLKKGGK